MFSDIRLKLLCIWSNTKVKLLARLIQKCCCMLFSASHGGRGGSGGEWAWGVRGFGGVGGLWGRAHGVNMSYFW